MKRLYLALAVVGLIVPYYFFINHLLAHGLDIVAIIRLPFANPVSTFFAIDLIITAIAFLIFSFRESKRLAIGYWWVFLLATLLVGPSFAFPLFLYAREGR